MRTFQIEDFKMEIIFWISIIFIGVIAVAINFYRNNDKASAAFALVPLFWFCFIFSDNFKVNFKHF